MSSHVTSFYNGDPEKEWNRLDDPYTKIELITTLHLIQKYFPKDGRICDIGGGPGKYSFELLRRGYDVTLVDLSSELLEVAKKENTKNERKLSNIICADAINLSMLPSASFDAILLLGPLYHLLEKNKRLAALKEAHRLLKKDGVAIIAYLNSWGIVRYGVARFPKLYEDLEFLRGLQKEQTLHHSFEGFTECFWSTPPQAMEEMQEAQFKIISRAGSEGLAAGMKMSVREMASLYPKAYENLLTVSKEVCELEQYRDSTEHIHFVVRKNE